MKLYKPYTDKEYADLAVYCNENNLIIEDKGDYLEGIEPIVPEPTLEEQKKKRAQAYLIEVDPITAHIQRERDEEEPDEEKISQLLQERTEKVASIKEKYPYPEVSEEAV